MRYIVIECTAVISLDSTAIHMIEGLQREFKERGIRVAFATVGNRMDKDLRRAGLIDKIGSRWFHPSVHSAVKFCTSHRALANGAALEECLTEEDLPSGITTPPPCIVLFPGARGRRGRDGAAVRPHTARAGCGGRLQHARGRVGRRARAAGKRSVWRGAA